MFGYMPRRKGQDMLQVSRYDELANYVSGSMSVGNVCSFSR